MILDTIHRLPFTPPEALEPWRTDVLTLLMDLVRTENEENAVLCMKTIMDFQRTYQKQLGDQVQPFLELIMDMFRQMPKAVKDTFDTPSAPSGATPSGLPSTPGNTQNYPMSPLVPGADPAADAQQPAKMLTKGMQSFKVLAECPIIVVSLFQAHRNSVNKNVKLFVPLIKEMLQLQAGPQREAHEQAKAEGKNFTGVSPKIKNRVAFGEFITAQVKVRFSAPPLGVALVAYNVLDHELSRVRSQGICATIDRFLAGITGDRSATVEGLPQREVGRQKGMDHFVRCWWRC
jgi:transformation/transcription domain-associated protein